MGKNIFIQLDGLSYFKFAYFQYCPSDFNVEGLILDFRRAATAAWILTVQTNDIHLNTGKFTRIPKAFYSFQGIQRTVCHLGSHFHHFRDFDHLHNGYLYSLEGKYISNKLLSFMHNSVFKNDAKQLFFQRNCATFGGQQ